MTRPLLRLLRILPGLALVACTATAPAPTTAPVAPAGPIPDSVHWVRNSAEYEGLALQTFRLAADRLADAAVGRDAGTWAVILDADETILDNSLYQKELALRGATFDRATWNEWVMRREAGAVPGADEFLDRVHELGGRIAIVTNRTVAQCPATEDVLRALGLAHDVVLCRGEDSDKNERWQRVEGGTASPDLPPLDVVMWLGDNIHDFPGADQAMRGDAAAFAELGERYVLLPNPMYGSWVANPRD